MGVKFSKVVVILLISSLTVALSGCNDGGGTTPPPQYTPPSQYTPTPQTPTPEPTPQMHLKITDIKVNPKPNAPPGQYAQLVSGTKYIFNFYVTNSGPSEGNTMSVVVRTEYFCTSCGGTPNIVSHDTTGIDDFWIGQPTLIFTDIVAPDTKGTYRFIFTVDPYNEYAPYDKSKLWTTYIDVI